MKFWKPIFLSSTLLLTVIGLGVGVVLGGAEDVPPQVVAVQPYPGEEVRVDQPLTVIFNQAMDKASTEAAFSLDPAVSGSFEWTDDKTLVFTPVSEWERGSDYEATISQDATAANGLTLGDDYTFRVRIVGTLEVSSTIPEDGVQGVEADATITVAFNRPVVPLGSTEDLENLPNPLTIEPEIAGHGEWLNTSIFSFTPDEPLTGGATYTVTINGGLTDFTGATLEDDYVFSFQTLLPEILSTYPQSGTTNFRLESPVSVNFSQPMNQAATEEAFTVFSQRSGEQVAGAYSWSEDGRTLTFTPNENLTIQSDYRLVIDAGLAKSVGGASIREGRDFSFSTVPLPFVQSTYPSNGEGDVSPGYRSISISFGTPMNSQTFEDKLVISPEPDEFFPSAGESYLSADFEFLEDTTYTVTLLAGTEDIYGNKIERDYTFSFKTGTVDPSIYLADTGRFVVTGSYRNDTALSASISAKPDVHFELYQAPVSQLQNMVWNMYNEDAQRAITNASTLIREWRQVVDGGSNYANVKINLASEEGGALPPGLYYVMAEHSQRGYLNRMPVALGVVNSTVTYKRMDDAVLVWVTDMQTGDPLANQDVRIFLSDEEIAHGTTDADGVLRMNLETRFDSQFLTIVASDETHYGLWYTSSTPNPAGEDVYIYTDRPIYRPGETVYFRGVYRNRDDVNFNAGGVETLHIQANVNYGSQILLETDVTLNEFGAFSGEIELPEDAQIGNLEIGVSLTNKESYSYWAVTAQIAEFRTPEFSVTVTPSQDEIIAGDPLNVLVNSTFFSGGSVSNANITWYANATQTSFNYTGAGRYSFSDTTGGFGYYADYGYGYGYGGYQRYLGDGQGTTDGSGNYLIELTNTVPEGAYPEQVTIEATVNDESGQYISGRSTAIIHPSQVYVGIRTDRYFGKENDPFNAEIITVTPDSEPVADQPVKLTLIERRWERTPIEGQFGRYNWEVKEIEVESKDVTTNADGTASVEFTPPNAGIFIVRAETRDLRERVHRSGTTLWVTGETSVWWGEPSTNIDLITNQDSYKPGDTAEILIPVSMRGRSWLLISVERDGVMEYEVIPVDGSTYVYELPIEDIHAPMVYVSVVLIHGIDEDNSTPLYRTGNAQLTVEPTSKLLDLTVTPSSINVQPGEEVTFDVQALNPDGTPAQAEVGLSMVDSAILTLAPFNSQSPEDHYYGAAGNFTYTDTMLSVLIDDRLDNTFGEDREEAATDDGLADESAERSVAQSEALSAGALAPAPTAAFAADALGEVGGGGFDQITVREDFQQTPLWEPSLRTDENGQAQISVTMPDNLTVWNLKARAITTDTLVGSVDLDVASTLPLLVRPVTPRFFVVGDEVTLAMVVNNNTGEVQTVNTTMQGSGYELINGSEMEQSVEIPANSRQRIEWNVKILDTEFVDLTFLALGADGYQDAAKPALATGPDGTIPVYRYTAPDTTGTGGVLREGGSRTEGITIPPIADTDQGTLTVQLDPSLAVTTLDALDYLKNYKHQCIEQTVSRFLPNVMTFRALQSLGVDDPELEADLRVVLNEAITKLKNEQNPDGGWGWFSSMESNSLVTAYALLGLTEAHKSGNDIPPAMLNGAAGFVRQNLIRPNEDTDEWLLNRQAFFLYVLARHGDAAYAPSQSELDALYNVRLEMSLYAKAYLLHAYATRFPDASDQIGGLTSDLISAAKLSATGAHWEEDYFDWWNWNTDVRSTSIVLSALLKVAPDNELLPNAVRWLMVARQGDHWETTQETAWAVMGLTDWMLTTNELQGNYDYAVTLNGEEATTRQVTPETVRDGETLVFQVSDLLLDEINRMTVIRGEGEGALYYTAHLRLRLDAAEVDAIDRGVSISREYFIGDSETSVTEATMGDIITVRLTINVPETIYYFVLEDPLPAGTEALDTSLLTTTRAVEGAQLRPSYNPYYWWWWWIWDHTEIRDEQVNLYADTLPPGTYVYSYQIQATVPGKFQTMPSYGYAFYFPEVFGRSDGELFTVKPAEE